MRERASSSFKTTALNSTVPLLRQREELAKFQHQLATLLEESKRLQKTAKKAQSLLRQLQYADTPSDVRDVEGQRTVLNDRYCCLINELQALALNENAVAVTLATEAFEDELSMVKRRLLKQPVVTKHWKEMHNRSRVTIRNIPGHYTQTEAICRYLNDGRDLVHWDDSPDCLLRMNENGSQTMIAYMQSAEAAEEVATRHDGRIEDNGDLSVQVDILQRTQPSGATPTRETVKMSCVNCGANSPPISAVATAPNYEVPDLKEPPTPMASPPPDPWINFTTQQEVPPIIPAENSTFSESKSSRPKSESTNFTVKPAARKGAKVADINSKPEMVQSKQLGKRNRWPAEDKIDNTVVCIRGLPAGCSWILPPVIEAAGGGLLYVNGMPKLVPATRWWLGERNELVFAYMESEEAASNVVNRLQIEPPALLSSYNLVWAIAGTSAWSQRH